MSTTHVRAAETGKVAGPLGFVAVMIHEQDGVVLDGDELCDITSLSCSNLRSGGGTTLGQARASSGVLVEARRLVRVCPWHGGQPSSSLCRVRGGQEQEEREGGKERVAGRDGPEERRVHDL